MIYWNHISIEAPVQNKLKALINARRVAGIHPGTKVDFQDNAKSLGIYAVRVTAAMVNRTCASEAATNNGNRAYPDTAPTGNTRKPRGWKVWVKLPGHPPMQQALATSGLSIPQYRPTAQIELPPQQFLQRVLPSRIPRAMGWCRQR